mgnify:CR=1 FL=1
MSKQRDRDEFIAIATKEGIPVDVARKLLRYAATLHRLAELECSSEAADRDRVPCPRSGKPAWIIQHEEGGRRVVSIPCLCQDYGSYSGDHGTVPRIAVHEARTQRRVETLCANLPGIIPVFQGDPRGAVLKLRVPSGRTNDGGQTGICVP